MDVAELQDSIPPDSSTYDISSPLIRSYIMSAAPAPPALHRFASTRPGTPSLNTVVCNVSPSIVMPSPPSSVSKHLKLKSSVMVHFRMPGFFRSSSSSSASVNSHSKPASRPSTPHQAATPAPVVISAPDVASATAHAPDTATQAAADIVEQIQETPTHKHEKQSEAHQIYRDQAGHASKGILPQTVNPVRSMHRSYILCG